MRILHLFDGTTPDEALAAARELGARLDGDRFDHQFASLDGAVAGRCHLNGTRMHRVPRRFPHDPTVGPRLRQFVARWDVDLLHAWGLDATITAASALPDAIPTVSTLMSPPAGPKWSRWFRAVGGAAPAAIACSAGLIHRRLIEGGVPPERCVVIRPGVDFNAIRQAKRDTTRADLGLPANGPVLLTLPPPSRSGGHYFATWAAAVLMQRDDSLRLIVPGVSTEQRRLQRLLRSLRLSHRALFTQRTHDFATLLAVADLVVVAAVDDVATTPLAWAMAAGIPIVGTAVPSVTELIADRHTGLLCKPEQPALLAARIRDALADRPLTAKVTDVARAQAFEVFSMRRMLDQYRQLYENVVAGERPDRQITDAAFRA